MTYYRITKCPHCGFCKANTGKGYTKCFRCGKQYKVIHKYTKILLTTQSGKDAQESVSKLNWKT